MKYILLQFWSHCVCNELIPIAYALEYECSLQLIQSYFVLTLVSFKILDYKLFIELMIHEYQKKKKKTYRK